MDGNCRSLRGNCPHQPVRRAADFSTTDRLLVAPTGARLSLCLRASRRRALHEMTEFYCNVALSVPLRTAFTYAVPESLRAQILPGSRVLVPFRKKTMVGVVLEMTTTVPEGTQIREIQKALDLIPALTPKLLELGQWIAGYYLAPIGEVFRAMLPPVTEISTRRKILLTEAGKIFAEKWEGARAERPRRNRIGISAKASGEEKRIDARTLEQTRSRAGSAAKVAETRLHRNSRNGAGSQAEDPARRGVESDRCRGRKI